MNENENDPCKVACVVAMDNGTFQVYKCASKEKPEGFRRIVRRFGGFTTYGAALQWADRIEEGRIR